ncbi:uncharacterized protein LOC122854105 [Aphidius gifuensis]|uniref:uncharacterized protein LOC122854105 n=1 Tax=Aphidius gifuensis TaxID=684658 RepID=UPI001CDCF138|nr:uncharacterized protein LOC122854105 [Aphidius gifuensis]
MGRPRSVIAQGSTPAPIDHVVNDDKIECLGSRRSLRLLSRITGRNGIAKCMKQNTQIKKNIKNAILLESSPLRPRSVIAQGSTPASIDHINHQHNDHYDAKNIIIDYVNDDCLAQIFMYVPACERLKIAMVCTKWKRALNYSWFNVTKLELTYWRYHEFPYCLEKYETVDGKLNFLKSLLDKCGRYLKTLDLTAYGCCNIVPIINDYCPNLEKLRLRFYDTDDTMLSNAFTRLSKLKSLTIIFEAMQNKIIPETLINSLKNVAGTLTELYLLNFVNHLDESCGYPKNLRYVIRRLKALKRFEVSGIRGFKNSFKYLKNNEMSFYLNHNQYLEKPRYLGHWFINIRKLDLTTYFIKDDTLYTIANTIKLLKMLTINCAQITDDGIVALSKMNNLQIIYLNGHSNITDSSIKLLKNIVKLSLPQSNKITDVSVTKLVENSPKIEKLLLYYTTSVTANFVKKAAKISSQRKQLLKISIHSLILHVKRYRSPYFKIYIIKNKE